MLWLASTLVTLTVPGPSVHCYSYFPIPPYVRVSPYTEVTLTVPAPSVDWHSSPLCQSISPHTRVTLIFPAPSVARHSYIPLPTSEYPRTPYPICQSIPVHLSYSDITGPSVDWHSYVILCLQLSYYIQYGTVRYGVVRYVPLYTVLRNSVFRQIKRCNAGENMHARTQMNSSAI